MCIFSLKILTQREYLCIIHSSTYATGEVNEEPHQNCIGRSNIGLSSKHRPGSNQTGQPVRDDRIISKTSHVKPPVRRLLIQHDESRRNPQSRRNGRGYARADIVGLQRASIQRGREQAQISK